MKHKEKNIVPSNFVFGGVNHNIDVRGPKSQQCDAQKATST
jgi:hypothetical protein